MGGNIMHRIQEILWESASLFFRPARSTNDTAIFSIYIFSIYYISEKKIHYGFSPFDFRKKLPPEDQFSLLLYLSNYSRLWYSSKSPKKNY